MSAVEPERRVGPNAKRVEVERAAPSAEFQVELRSRLLDSAPILRRVPIGAPGQLIAIFGGLGLLLLAIAVAGLAGVGPLGPD